MEIRNSWIMGVATVATFGLLFMIMFVPIPDKNAQIFLAVFGMIGAFFFGSSINKQRPPIDMTVTPPTVPEVAPAIPKEGQ